jgi:hypothetical protein
MRRDLVPMTSVAPFDFDQAVHAGLAAYYLPAMDDWSRSIVRPLAVEGFRRAMREARTAYEDATTLDAAAEAWEHHLRLGELVLHRYFAFAAAFDDFDSVLADEDLWAPVPDPDDPVRELGTADGRPVRFLCRLDQLISDDDDEWWVVDHRVTRDGWADDAALLGDLDTVRTWWALEVAYPQICVAGTVHNELLVTADDGEVAVPPDGAELDRRDMSAGARHANLRRAPLTPEERILWSAVDRPNEIVHREATETIRRTWVRRGRGELHAVGLDLSEEAMAMVASDVPVPPNPSAEVCGRCPFLHPCLVMESGGDPESALVASYRRRRDDEFDEAGLRSAARRRARSHLGANPARH